MTVAVVDSGIDLSNPDLGENLWANPGEIAGNGVDDDANGFVDDVHGVDTVSHDGDPADGLGHGTAVASLIGARGDNGLGITGVAWRVRLMPVKVLHDRGWGTTVTLITGLRYALANGARIINLSVNGSEPSQALEEAIRQAEAQGALVVTSAGNDGQDRDQGRVLPGLDRLARAAHGDVGHAQRCARVAVGLRRRAWTSPRPATGSSPAT